MFFEGSSLVDYASLVATLLLVISFCLALIRIIKGPTPFDRIIALDLIGGLCFCLIVLFSIRYRQAVLLDAALVIALVSFMGTVALARYLARGGEE